MFTAPLCDSWLQLLDRKKKTPFVFVFFLFFSFVVPRVCRYRLQATRVPGAQLQRGAQVHHVAQQPRCHSGIHHQAAVFCARKPQGLTRTAAGFLSSVCVVIAILRPIFVWWRIALINTSLSRTSSVEFRIIKAIIICCRMRAERQLLSLNEPLARLWLFLVAPALVKHIFTLVWLVRSALACGHVGTAAELKCTPLGFLSLYHQGQ